MINQEILKNFIKEAIREVLSEYNIPPKSNTEELLSQRQLIEKLDIGRSTITGWTDQGKLKPRYIGKKPYYLMSEVLAMLEEKNIK